MIGENIKKFRKEKKIRQIDLAEKLNVTEGVISLWEHNLRTPDIYVVKNIAKILGVSIAELLDEEILVEQQKKALLTNFELTKEQQALLEKIKTMDDAQCIRLGSYADRLIDEFREQKQLENKSFK